MNHKAYLKPVFGFLLTLAVVTSCVRKDNWDTPPINCNNKFKEPTISMADFVAQAPGSGTITIANEQIFEGYVVSSDEQGNFYKTISFQDKPENPTVGLQIEVDRSSNYADFPVGSHIRISAKGLVLGTDKGVVKLGSVDPTYAIGRIPSSLFGNYISTVCSNGKADIVKLTPLPLATLTEAKQVKHINKLVTVLNVQFADEEVLLPTGAKTYINFDPEKADTDRNLEDTSGATAVLRTSSFAKFGADVLPSGKGNITFVVSRYNTNYQMIIRSKEDVQFTDTRSDTTPPKGGTAIVYASATTLEDFTSYATGAASEAMPKYINDPALGNRYWRVNSFGGNKYIQLSGNLATTPLRTFFIVPVNFSAMTQFSFQTKDGYNNGKVLKVYYSANYTPLGDVTKATLMDITGSFSISNVATANAYAANFLNSGVWTKPSTLSGNGFILFEYYGGQGLPTTTMQIDNIKIE